MAALQRQTPPEGDAKETTSFSFSASRGKAQRAAQDATLRVGSSMRSLEISRQLFKSRIRAPRVHTERNPIMEFGYFTLSDNHYKNNRRSANQVVTDILDEAVYAEEVGLNSAW